jgi:hypothetical protein
VARSAALRTIDRFRDDLPTDAGERLVEHVEKRDPLGLDSRYLAAVGASEYASAFVKLLMDPQPGHLRFDKGEVEAVRAVSQVESERAAMAVGTGSTGGFAAPFQIDPSIMISGTGGACDEPLLRRSTRRAVGVCERQPADLRTPDAPNANAKDGEQELVVSVPHALLPSWVSRRSTRSDALASGGLGAGSVP